MKHFKLTYVGLVHGTTVLQCLTA